MTFNPFAKIPQPPRVINGVIDPFEQQRWNESIYRYLSEGRWRDIDFPINIRTPAAGRPTPTALPSPLSPLESPLWAVGDYYDMEEQEIVHEWLEGTELIWHAHIITGGTDTTDRYINLQIDFSYANYDTTFPALITATSGDVIIPANTVAPHHLIIPIYRWTPAIGTRIACHVKARMTRIAATGTAPTTDIYCEMVQLHAECEVASGSRAETRKI